MEGNNRTLFLAVILVVLLKQTKALVEEVKETVGIEVEMQDLKFKYSNRDNKESEFLINITDVNFADELRKIWNYDVDLKIITHGWISSDASLAVANIKNAYLSKTDFNVITLDWSYTASTKNYPVPAVMTHQVGILAAEMVNKLVELNFTQYDRIHMIGHSLGAHVSGATGTYCKEKMARITGLDPAGPGFMVLMGNDMRLDMSDAQFVDVIHTAAGVAGYYGVLGHADFYPNSGKPPQPGCVELSLNVYKVVSSGFGCSHMRSYELYTESIVNPKAFKSIKCDSWYDYESKTYCNESDIQYMGDPVQPTARGVYYLATGDKPPYSLIDNMTDSISRAASLTGLLTNSNEGGNKNNSSAEAES
ncbi:hypothetical protein M8J75_015521 [Diaphorina citri]|nr:hypothetical protein M8J75_015521 [Diaphorina citri]